jgi:hypothetical protein
MFSINAFHGLNLDSGQDVVRRVYRDGTMIEMGTNGANAETMHYSATLDPEEMWLWSDTRATAYAIHPISWTFDFSKPLTSGIVSGDWSNEAVFWREPDGTQKYIRNQGTKSVRQFDVLTGADEGDTVIFASGPDIIDRGPILMGGNDIAFLSPGTGRIIVIDWVTKVTKLDSFITAFAACAFDRNNRNFVSIRDSDDRIQVWEENIEPSAVSTPVASPGSSLRYLAETMSVIVTGADGELIPNVLVDWTVVENPGLGPSKGSMNPAQSKTNVLGVATSVYCPPGLDWVTGDDELITATVTV